MPAQHRVAPTLDRGVGTSLKPGLVTHSDWYRGRDTTTPLFGLQLAPTGQHFVLRGSLCWEDRSQELLEDRGIDRQMRVTFFRLGSGSPEVIL